MSTIADSPLANKDLAPTGPAQRTRGTYLRRAQLEQEELYRPDPGGAYWYSSGYNWRALLAAAAGVIPVLPGFLHSATTEGGVIADPDFLDHLYRYGVFVAFGISAIVYLALSRAEAGARSPATATAD